MPEGETQETIEVPARKTEAPYGAKDDGGSLNWPMLLLFAVILAGVAASNVWLRRRAERQRKQDAAP